jgi:hypothetical protein
LLPCLLQTVLAPYPHQTLGRNLGRNQPVIVFSIAWTPMTATLHCMKTAAREMKMLSKCVIVLATTLAIVVCAGQQSLAQSSCGAAAAFSHGDAPVIKLRGSALKFSRPLAINMDGAPNAYHINGRPAGALDTLCNAGQAISSEHGTYHGYVNCGQFLEDVKAAQQNGWHGDPRIKWYGIATIDDAHNEPIVQGQGPYKGYFVSTTKFENTAFKEADPRRYLDSRVVPFIVLPGNSAFFSQGGAKLGNVAFVYDPKSQQSVFAIAGDLGPADALGEGSIALAAAIKGKTVDPATLTGKQAKALAIDQPIVTILFSGRMVQPPFDRAQIEAAGAEAAEAFGGLELLKSCAAAP